MARVRVVLVRPAASSNVGACARVVRNAGLAGLDLVEPGDYRTVECWRTAWGAHDVLEQARVFDSLKDAKPPRKPTCKCARCGKQLYADSCGNFVSDGATGAASAWRV